jgi:hypothetical protein
MIGFSDVIKGLFYMLELCRLALHILTDTMYVWFLTAHLKKGLYKLDCQRASGHLHAI